MALAAGETQERSCETSCCSSSSTIDGVAEEPGDWFFDDSPELFEHIGAVIGTQSDVLLGRGT